MSSWSENIAYLPPAKSNLIKHSGSIPGNRIGTFQIRKKHIEILRNLVVWPPIMVVGLTKDKGWGFDHSNLSPRK